MDSEKLEQCINDFNCDALAVIPGEFPEIKRLISKAQELRIPIIYYNIDSEFGERMCYVGCDYQKAGRIAAGMTALSIEKQGKVCVVSYPGMSKYSYQERVIGFDAEMEANHPNIQVAERILLTKWEQGEKEVSRLYQDHPDLKAIYLVNPGDYSICRKIRETMQGDIRIITNDMIAPEILGNGTADVAITQEPLVQGSQPLQFLFDYLAYGQKPETPNFYTKLAINVRESI